MGLGRRGEGWLERGEGSLRVSFQDGFYGVTSNADLPYPRPYIPLFPRSIRASTGPTLLFLTIVYGQVDRNWLFFHEADFSTLFPPTGRGPFAAPLEVIVFVCTCVYVVNMPDGRYQVVERGLHWLQTLQAFHSNDNTGNGCNLIQKKKNNNTDLKYSSKPCL